METAGVALIVIMVLFNAVSFFKASEKQKDVYKTTVEDTSFNKSRS